MLELGDNSQNLRAVQLATRSRHLQLNSLARRRGERLSHGPSCVKEGLHGQLHLLFGLL